MGAVMRGLVLFAHGSSDPNWTRSITALERRVNGALKDVMVKAAFLQDCSPSIFDVVGEMASAGCARITIIPMFLAAGSHSTRDFPRIRAKLVKVHPEVGFEWTEVIGQWEETLEALANALISRLS